ncbi:MAG: efflux RND transporter periplasmic adaptor subunit [Paracoccaceae bacterium]
MRALKSYGVALILVLGVAVWLSTGLLVRGGKGPIDGEVTIVSALESDGGPITDAVDASGFAKSVHHEEGVNDPALSIAQRSALANEEAGPSRSVRVQRFDIGSMPLEITLRGHTAAQATVNATAQTKDIIKTLDVVEGQSVDIGDLICSLETGTRQASVDQAAASLAQSEAALLQAQSNYNTNQSLRLKNLASVNSADGFAAALSAAKANHQAASVALRNREVELGYTAIHATVPGIIQRPLAEVGDLLNAGGSCARIVQLDPMIFIGAVPQSHIDLARLGLPAQIRTINGREVIGEVSFVSVSSNPATRTFAIEIEFPNAGGKVLDGLTAEAKLTLGIIPAHLLPQSIMTLDSDGKLGVRAVKDDVVVFYHIGILNDTRDGIWVSGLPASVDVIVVGQEYVIAGQSVTASSVDVD